MANTLVDKKNRRLITSPVEGHNRVENGNELWSPNNEGLENKSENLEKTQGKEGRITSQSRRYISVTNMSIL